MFSNQESFFDNHIDKKIDSNLSSNEVYSGLKSSEMDQDSTDTNQQSQQDKNILQKKRIQRAKKAQRYRNSVKQRTDDMEEKIKMYYQQIKVLNGQTVDQATKQQISEVLELYKEFNNLMEKKEPQEKRPYVRREDSEEKQKIIRERNKLTAERSRQRKKEKIRILKQIMEYIEILDPQLVSTFNENKFSSEETATTNNTNLKQSFSSQNESDEFYKQQKIEENDEFDFGDEYQQEGLENQGNQQQFIQEQIELQQQEKIEFIEIDQNNQQNGNYNEEQEFTDNIDNMYEDNSSFDFTHKIKFQQENSSSIRLDSLNPTYGQDSNKSSEEQQKQIIDQGNYLTNKNILYTTSFFLVVAIIAVCGSVLDEKSFQTIAVKLSQSFGIMQNNVQLYDLDQLSKIFSEHKQTIQYNRELLKCNQDNEKDVYECYINNISEEMIKEQMYHLEKVQEFSSQENVTDPGKLNLSCLTMFTVPELIQAFSYNLVGEHHKAFLILEAFAEQQIEKNGGEIDNSFQFWMQTVRSIVECQTNDIECLEQQEDRFHGFLDKFENEYAVKLAYYNIAQFYFVKNFKLDKAKMYIDQSAEYLQKIPDPHTQFIYTSLAKLKIHIDTQITKDYKQCIQSTEELYAAEKEYLGSFKSIYQLQTVNLHKKCLYLYIEENNLQGQIDNQLIQEIEQYRNYDSVKKPISKMDKEDLNKYDVLEIRNSIKLDL